MPSGAHPALAAHGWLDLESRVKLAANPATPASLLAGLAGDGAVTVRAAVALNPSLPQAAQSQLACDTDDRIRLLLARKLAASLHGLSGQSQMEFRDRTLAILSSMVRDEMVRIRAVIADTVASMPDIPHSLALLLAKDSAIQVSEPVLRLSPLLSAEDLLALLAAPPHGQTAAAIACRANLPASVADAIAATADSPAICALLGNASAAIRETTLDNLIERAAGEPGWHAPLVRRPVLPDHAARALAEIVTGQILAEFATRPDLPADLLAAIRARLAAGASRVAPPGLATDDALLEEARQLADQGALDEPRLAAALRAGEERRACAMLAVAAGLPLVIVQRAALLRSAKGLVSLTWKAGYSAHLAMLVQTTIGHIAPSALIPSDRTGQFLVTAEEMQWQLDFLGGAGR